MYNISLRVLFEENIALSEQYNDNDLKCTQSLSI